MHEHASALARRNHDSQPPTSKGCCGIRNHPREPLPYLALGSGRQYGH